ncbi:MAG: hypothetical protein BRD23_06475 [Halobacteriales archaeon SW_9_67_25]|jgi:hypothetical protein|nr:MAG: hypothetical protein BRD23_06475 [Halobacteriales archaeon SW_9_67_25]
MYVSHPVRRIREDPTPGEAVGLRVTAVDDRHADALAGDIAAIGTVEERLRFGGLRVTVPQARVEDVCTLDGIEAVETASTVAIDAGDAGEDVASEEK